jgi:hypothetical protein
MNSLLSCSINVLHSSRPGRRQINLTPGANLPGFYHPDIWLHRFYLNRPAKEPIFSPK